MGAAQQGQEILSTPGVVDFDIDTSEAWAHITGSSDIIVGVLDTGIRYTHSDLAANMLVNQMAARVAASGRTIPTMQPPRYPTPLSQGIFNMLA